MRCVRAVGPLWRGESWGKGGKVLGGAMSGRPPLPQPADVVQESLLCPPFLHEPQPVAACSHGWGCLARERDP